MKIIIPVNKKSIESEVSDNFGRAPFFMIYESDNKENIFIENPAISSTGGAGIKAAQSVLDSGADVLLTPRCGKNAAEVINAADIKIYKTTNNSVKENIEAYLDGKLSLLDEIHPGFHANGEK